MVWFLCFLSLFLSSLSANPFVSTESDPDAFIQNCVNVINGDYCEVATDLVISGPDPLVLQRYYSTNDPISGTRRGAWRIFPQRFLVIGKDKSGKSCTIGKDRFEATLAYAGERSGGILPYSGWRNTNGVTKDPLKIDIFNKGLGMVNTYASEMNGQTNHQNNQLFCKGDQCELTLGDGTKRFYRKVTTLPKLLLGEELTPLMADQVINPSYFLLSEEILPSGNRLFFSYDDEGHLTSVEMKNKTSKKILSWIRFTYDFQEAEFQVHMETSDARKLTYRFTNDQLTHVEGSHCRSIAYDYKGALTKKILPGNRFIEIDYQDGKVKSLKSPDAQTGKAALAYTFSYGSDYTDVYNAIGMKTRYVYDKRFQLISIERYDDQNTLYRTEEKYFGKIKSQAGLLLAKTIRDGMGRVHSYRSFQYDQSGNVIEERLYGNLTGKQEASLQVSPEGKLLSSDGEECHIKTFGYSTDGFNLLTKVGDSKGNQTLYSYQNGTNLLTRKLIYEKGTIQKRTFQSYNEDGVCIKIIEDDWREEDESKYNSWYSSASERHIKKMTPKQTLPGVGLPEVIEEYGLDFKKDREILIKKMVNSYDDRSNLVSSVTYDAKGQYAFEEKKAYDAFGKTILEIDALGKETSYTYDEIGNQLTISIPRDNRLISTTYDFNNQPIQVTEGEFFITNQYDWLGRKICSTDRFGNPTRYEYDVFNRLVKVIHPEVLDENGQAAHPIFSYSYDIFDNVLSIKDPKGFITTKTYNLRGDPTRISYPDGSCEIFKYDVEGSLHRSLTRDQIITVYEYDYLGRPIYEESSTADDKGVHSFIKGRTQEYNGFRCRLEKEGNSAKSYHFDHAGRVTSIIERHKDQRDDSLESRLTEIFYDSLGRIHQKKVWFDTGPNDYALETYNRDLSGNIIEKKVEDAQGVILLQKWFSYNTQGQCTEEFNTKTCYNAKGDPISYTDGLSQETKILIDYSYQNNLGQSVLKKTIVNPLGMQTEIEFDALGRVFSIYKKDPLGTLLSSQKTLYDLLGNKACEIHEQIVDGNVKDTQKMRWVYGPMGRLEEEIIAADSPLEKRTCFKYNSLGKLVNKTSSDSIDYIYNKEGRLQKLESQPISINYKYDSKGNIVSADSLGKSVTRTYNPFDQVIKETVNDGEGTYNLLFAYDRKGRLKQITLPDLSKISYIYDAVFGREVQRISSKNEVLYSHKYDQYDTQGKLLNETHIGYVGTTEYAYDPNGQKVSSKNEILNEEYTRDSLGRVVEIKGAKNEEYRYSPLSQLISENTKTYTYDSLDNRIKEDNEELVHNALNQLTSSSRVNCSYDSNGNLMKKVLDGEETRFENNLLSQLISMEKADKTKTTYSYDPFGRLLVQKESGLSTSRYFYIGYQEIGSLTAQGGIESLKIPGLQGDELSQKSVAFEIKGTTYVPLHDMAGNVVHLVEPQTQDVVESYQYTTFGKEISNSVPTIENPWRFAEKRFDPKSGLILFGLRFYDPTTGRWISQDPAGLIDGPNLYAYLHNNPLGYLDRYGLAAEPKTSNKFEQYMFGEYESHCYCESHRQCKRGGDIGKTVGTYLPKVTYNDDFDAFSRHVQVAPHGILIKNFYEASSRYDLTGEGLPDLPNNLGIGFVNGVWNDLKGAQESARYISELSGGYNIHGVHNATHGTGTDIGECELGLRNIATTPVRLLHEMWNSYFEKSAIDAKFLMIAHSQGVIHTMNALLDYPPNLRERILVVAIAPGGYIYKETCAQVIHYRADPRRDFIPHIDHAGAQRERETIVNLHSHPNAPKFDHVFASPTYRETLDYHIQNYISSEGKEL